LEQILVRRNQNFRFVCYVLQFHVSADFQREGSVLADFGS
jgi:hypothetical protein